MMQHNDGQLEIKRDLFIKSHGLPMPGLLSFPCHALGERLQALARGDGPASGCADGEETCQAYQGL